MAPTTTMQQNLEVVAELDPTPDELAKRLRSTVEIKDKRKRSHQQCNDPTPIPQCTFIVQRQTAHRRIDQAKR
jgi:hypothetical protein